MVFHHGFDQGLQRVQIKAWLEQSAPFAINVMWVCIIAGPTIWMLNSSLGLTDMDKTLAASWAQAIVAIMSILATWLIARQESNRARGVERRADLAKCVAVLGALRHSLKIVSGELDNVQEKKVYLNELLADIEKSSYLLDSIDLLLLPDPDLASAVFESKYAIECLARKIKSYKQPYIARFSYQFGMSRACIEVLQAQIEACSVVVNKFS